MVQHQFFKKEKTELDEANRTCVFIGHIFTFFPNVREILRMRMVFYDP